MSAPSFSLARAAACGLLAMAAGLAQAQRAPAVGVPSFAAAIERNLPSTFGVYALNPDAAAAGDAQAGDGRYANVGAGFVIDAQGLAVTAAHVVTGQKEAVLRLHDQRVVLAQVLAEDMQTDIALLRLPMRPPVPQFGRSAALRTGDWVLAIGEPYGLNRSVAAGIVAGKDRHLADDRELHYIQTDLALNPGNSGGPLLDAAGAVVAMNVGTVVGMQGTPGVSLSVPIEIVLQIAGELERSGSIQRPRLGADFTDLSPPGALARGRSFAHGALLTEVPASSLAHALGLRTGDVIVGMNGRPVGHSADLARVLLAWRSVEETRIVVLRDSGYVELRAPSAAR